MNNDEARMTHFAQKILTGSSLVGLTALLCCACSSDREPKVHILGKISGNSYASPNGHFSVPYPVSPEVGGRILHDDAQSVIFHDNWGSKIGFFSRQFNDQSPMMTVMRTQGREKALDTLAMDIYGKSIKLHYHADIRGGAISFIYLKPIGPKTGVAAFASQNRVYLVETDLLPGVQLLSKDDAESQEIRDEWLENRALELLQTIEVK